MAEQERTPQPGDEQEELNDEALESVSGGFGITIYKPTLPTIPPFEPTPTIPIEPTTGDWL